MRLALDVESSEDVVNGGNEVVELSSIMARSRGDAEALFANRDGGVVDGLNVDTVIGEESVGSSLGKRSIAD